LLFTKRLMGLVPARFAAGTTPQGVVIRAATAPDFGDIVRVDAVAFGESEAVERPWLALLTDHRDVTIAVAEWDGGIVAAGELTRSAGRAGPAGYVSGIAVLPQARRRGIGTALSSWLVARAFSDGGQLAHLHPDTDEAAGIYRRLGFTEVTGLDIYVDL